MLDTGLIFRNPKPHLFSRQASFPSLARLPNGEMLCAFGVGAGFESADNHTELARSRDGGRTWALEGAVFHEETDRPTSSNLRISRLPGGELVAMGIRADRHRRDEGLSNPETQGFVETEILFTRSADDGHAWEPPRVVAPPLIGPAFEVCSPIVGLRDGRWLWPTSTWKGWNGENPTGMKAIALVSHDRGRTWPEYINVMDGASENVLYWEQKLIDLGDGRLLAMCWTHDVGAGADRNAHYALSSDGGRSFSPPRSTGLHGQTSTPIALGGGRLAIVYRRTDRPGLWAAYARLEGDRLIHEGERGLWGHVRPGEANAVTGDNLSQSFAVLKFGLPAGLVLDDGSLFVAFWCVEECLYVIRWLRIPSHAT